MQLEEEASKDTSVMQSNRRATWAPVSDGGWTGPVSVGGLVYWQEGSFSGISPSAPVKPLFLSLLSLWTVIILCFHSIFLFHGVLEAAVCVSSQGHRPSCILVVCSVTSAVMTTGWRCAASQAAWAGPVPYNIYIRWWYETSFVSWCKICYMVVMLTVVSVLN